jgi:CheY-like chemotaxis protein
MTNRLTSTFPSFRDGAEGSPESREIKEPLSPLQTTSTPVVKTGMRAAPTAETGLAATVVTLAEGKDKHDSQDASRTTAETEAAPAPQKVPDTVTPHSPSVLIIEDTTELAEVIQATLERKNMVTVHETHGGKALIRFSELNPEVVLLDIGLPDMTGWKFLETVKEKYKDRSPVIIIITAYGDPANRLVGKLQGVHDYLIKPFTSDEVERVVMSALGSRTQ